MRTKEKVSKTSLRIFKHYDVRLGEALETKARFYNFFPGSPVLFTSCSPLVVSNYTDTQQVSLESSGRLIVENFLLY